MAEKSYYLEKAKLEKEGLDPVSYFSGRSLCREALRCFTLPVWKVIQSSSWVVILLRTVCKEAACEATASCFCFLFSQGMMF